MAALLRALIWLTVVAMATLVLDSGATSQKLPVSNRGYDPSTSTNHWMFFKYTFPKDWSGVTEQEYAVYVTETDKSWQRRQPLHRVRTGLWEVHMEDSWRLERVVMIFRDSKKTTLSKFVSKAWSSHDSNDLQGGDVKRTDTDFADEKAIVVRRLWVSVDTTDSALDMSKASYVQYLPPGDWQVGSSFCQPMDRAGVNEFITSVWIYESMVPGERPKQAQIRVFDADGKELGRAEVPITVQSVLEIDDP